MSDLYLSVGIHLQPDMIAQQMRFSHRSHTATGTSGGFIWVAGRVDDNHLWGPAWDPESKTRVLLGGRIALEESEWAAAERLPFHGGLAARHLLSLWRTRGAEGIVAYNGAAMVVVLDENDRRAHLWTDRMGFYPAFVRANEREAIIASHPDFIAKASAYSGRPLQLDEIALATFLRAGTPFHSTYWRGVHHLTPGSYFQLSAGVTPHLTTGSRYWKPAFLEGAPPISTAEFVESFAAGLRAAGRRRSWKRLGRTVVLLSAGADSRGILAATGSPADVDCYTYFDEPNEELGGARTIAELANARHFALKRSPDYYVTHAAQTVRLSGGMWSIDSGHHTGFAESIWSGSSPGTVLTADFCDLLYKGLALNRQHMQFFGRNLPLHRLAKYQHEYWLPFSPISSDWLDRVNERLDDLFNDALGGGRDPRRVELLRVSPNSHFTLWRLLPLELIALDNDLLETYGRLSVEDKISGIAFGQAVARVTGPAIAAVPNNNFGAPVGASETGRVAAFLLASARRKLRRLVGLDGIDDPSSVATSGSWPNLARVAINSPLMRQWFEEIPTRHGEALLGYLHPGSREWSFDEFAVRDTFLLYRLITADLWLKQCGRLSAPATPSETRGTLSSTALHRTAS